MTDKESILLMDSTRIRRTLKRIVFQIAEKAGDREVLLVGLNEGGGALATEMGEYLGAAREESVEVVRYDVGRDEKIAEKIHDDYDFSGKMIVIVDDVIFGGKTMFLTLKELIVDTDCLVFTAVLIDRGHRTLPVNAGFVGMDIATKLNEHVELILSDDRAKKVILYKLNGSGSRPGDNS